MKNDYKIVFYLSNLFKFINFTCLNVLISMINEYTIPIVFSFIHKFVFIKIKKKYYSIFEEFNFTLRI